jgi:hypothetical protein
MSVYVDGGGYAYGRMKMCHMLADDTAELLAMADRIGVQRKWLQKEGKPDEHFDVCKAKRALAVKAGAKEVDGRELVRLIRARRPTASPETRGGK